MMTRIGTEAARRASLVAAVSGGDQVERALGTVRPYFTTTRALSDACPRCGQVRAGRPRCVVVLVPLGDQAADQRRRRRRITRSAARRRPTSTPIAISQ